MVPVREWVLSGMGSINMVQFEDTCGNPINRVQPSSP